VYDVKNATRCLCFVVFGGGPFQRLKEKTVSPVSSEQTVANIVTKPFFHPLAGAVFVSRRTVSEVLFRSVKIRPVTALTIA